MKLTIIWLLLSMPFIASAQKTHTVVPKESFYSIGRLYNVHPRDLATYNNIDFDKGLAIGQVIKIPPASSASPMPVLPEPTSSPQPVAKEQTNQKQSTSSVPIYHKVEPKEGLYGLSKKYNASIDDIKKWNNLSSDALNIGMNIIVGYGTTSAPVVVSPLIEKKAPETTIADDVYVDTKPQVITTPPLVSKETVVQKSNNNLNGGFFKSFYDNQIGSKSVREDTGLAGIFKSMSGWEDGKYYCLHNAAPAGSFVKITNTINNKVIYAKVLDLIPNLNQNKSLVIQVSSAAAAELGVTGNSFEGSIAF